MANGNTLSDAEKHLLAGCETWNEYKQAHADEVITFSKLNFASQPFNGYDLSLVVFEACDFSGAYFTDAHLEGVRFHKCWLVGAHFEGQTVGRVDFSTARGLNQCLWGGADLQYCRFPDEFLAPALEKVKESTVTVKNVFNTFVTLSLFSLLGFSVADKELATNAEGLSVAFVLANTPIRLYFHFTPVIVFIIFFVYHIHLYDWWKDTRDLPSVFPNGKSLERMIQPWLFHHLVRVPGVKVSSEEVGTPLFLLDYFFLITSYVLGPSVILRFWYEYIPRHGIFTVLHIFLFWLALLVAWRSYGMASILWKDQKYTPIKGLSLNLFPRWLANWWVFGPSFIVFWLSLLSFWVCFGPEKVPFGHFYLRLAGESFSGPQVAGLPSQNQGEFSDNPKRQQEISDPNEGSENRNPKPHQENPNRSTERKRWWGRNFNHADLREVIFFDDDLQETTFFKARLSEAAFYGTHLEKSNFTEADLREARFLEETNLFESNFKGAKLVDATFHNVTLNGANFHGAKLNGATFKGVVHIARAEFYGAEMKGFTCLGPNLNEGLFKNADLTRAVLNDTHLIHADLESCNLTAAQLNRSKLSRANLTNSILKDALLNGADLTKADLTGADLTRAQLQGTVLCGADLTGAKGLTLAQMKRAFIDAATILPEDLEPDRVQIPVCP